MQLSTMLQGNKKLGSTGYQKQSNQDILKQEGQKVLNSSPQLKLVKQKNVNSPLFGGIQFNDSG